MPDRPVVVCVSRHIISSHETSSEPVHHRIRNRTWRPNVIQPRGPLTRCPTEVAAACAARLCCVLPSQSLHHRVFSAMAAANTKELATHRENGGIHPQTRPYSTISQVHTCRGIWAASAHVVALPQPCGVQTCTAAFLLPALVPDPPSGGPHKTLCRGVRDGC